METYQRQFVEVLPVAEEVITTLCRYNALPDGDEDNFRSLAITKLIEDNYKVLRQFRSECNLRTYLTIVLRRVLLDFRSHRWGKWRPSTAARKHGTVAVRLEQLIARDGLTFREAVSTLRTNLGFEESSATLDDIVSRLPVRSRLRVEGANLLPEVVDRAPLPDAVARRHEGRAEVIRLQTALREALRELPDVERRILKLRFLDNLPVNQIACALDSDAKAMYRRIDGILARLRRHLNEKGIGKDVAREALHVLAG